MLDFARFKNIYEDKLDDYKSYFYRTVTKKIYQEIIRGDGFNYKILNEVRIKIKQKIDKSYFNPIRLAYNAKKNRNSEFL